MAWYKTIDVEELKVLENKMRKIILYIKCGNRMLAVDELMKIRDWLEGLGIGLEEIDY